MKKEETITDFSSEVQKESGVDVNVCLQCGTCTGGCVQEWAMDYNSRRIMQMILHGDRRTVLSSKAIWMCSSCYTCSARCPRGIDLAKVMNALRIMSRQEGLVNKEAKVVPLFMKTFLDLVKKYGRVHEPGLLMRHNILSGRLMKDAGFGPKLFLQGKIDIIPEKIKNLEEIREIFKQAEAT
jgi:heterodisulfide reductase subunit C